MTNWTPTARATLEQYLAKNRASLVVAGGDVEEVSADLRRHVEAEVDALKLPVVTEQDVYRILRQIGPVPPEFSTSTAGGLNLMEATKKSTPVRSGMIFVFGVLLPVISLVWELATHSCADILFDPIPTWFHVFLVALVPVANFVAWNKSNQLSEKAMQWLWRANGAALGVSLLYSLLFLPITPAAFIGILFFGIGFLALAPLFSFIAILSLRVRLIIAFKDRLKNPPSGWWLSFFSAAGLLLLLASPGPLTRYWMDEAGSDSPDVSSRAIKWLRAIGNENAMLKECYGSQDRLWVDDFGGRRVGSELAQKVYFRVYGRPYNSVAPPVSKYQRNGRALLEEFEWDGGLGGGNVAGQVKGLSMLSSRLDGISKAEEGWAYIEWTMEFRNEHKISQREARAQIQLPPGGVVSRLTLWVNGEEREAAFAGRGEVREAYQKVAVVQRRDPVLVTTSGPDRVLMQCFPIQPNGGTMKLRVGITAPLTILDEESAALRLPCIVERNFRIPESTEHNVWLESSQADVGNSNRYQAHNAADGKRGIRAQLTDRDIGTAEGVLRFKVASSSIKAEMLDTRAGSSKLIRQSVETSPTKIPSRIAIVLDGSLNMTKVFPEIGRTLDGLPSQPELSVWLAKDGLQHVYDSAWRLNETASGVVGRLKGVGGQDCLPALLAAWEWASMKPDSVVIWIHGAQPVVLGSLVPLQQRLDWRIGDQATQILDVPVEAGPNRIAEKLSTTSAMKALARYGTLNTDLEQVFARWSGRQKEFHLVRTADPVADGSGKASRNGSSHVARLWATDEIKRLVALRNMDAAIRLAGLYQIVTSVSGAVVLETKQQFEQAGLTPVDPATVPVVPEPSTCALFVIGIMVLLVRTKFSLNKITHGAS